MAFNLSVRSRRALWTPDDAEELADISSFWSSPRVAADREAAAAGAAEDEELELMISSDQQLLSVKCAQGLQLVVRNSSSSLSSSDAGVMSSRVDCKLQPDIRSCRMRKSLADTIMPLETQLSCTSSWYDEEPGSSTSSRDRMMERTVILHSPSSKILHPMQSLLLEKMSSGPSPMSSPGLLSPSPKAAQQSPLSCPTSSSEESDKLKTNVAELRDQLLLPVLSSQLQNCGEQEESEAAAPRGPAPADATSEDRERSCFVKKSGEQEARDSICVEEPAAPAPSTAPSCSSVVMVVYDAERKPTTSGLDYAINTLVKEGDEIILVGYLQHVTSPMGHRMVADTSKFNGVNEKRLRMEMAERKQAVENMISDTGRLKACAQKKVKLSARISPGALPRSVVVREAESLHATWVIFDRNALKEKKIYYVEHLKFCHVLKMTKDGRSTETIRSAQLQQLGSRQTPLANAAAVAATVGVWQSVMSMPAEAYSDDIYSSISESWRSLDRESVVGVTTSTRSNGSSNSSSDSTAAASSSFFSSFYSLWSKIKSCRSLPRSRSSLVEQQKSAIGRSSTISSSPIFPKIFQQKQQSPVSLSSPIPL